MTRRHDDARPERVPLSTAAAIARLIRRPRACIDHPVAPLVWPGRYRGVTKTVETLSATVGARTNVITKEMAWQDNFPPMCIPKPSHACGR